jgi:hypothetical protein
MNALPEFGSDDATNVTFETVAAQVKALKPRALTPTQHDDVITLIEYLQDETVRRYDALTRKGNELAEREAAIAAAERAMKVKGRVVEAIVKGREGRGWTFWRKA